MLWIDEQRPKTLRQLNFHEALTARLQRLANDGEIPHLLVHGPPGAGKATRISCLLRAMYGVGAERKRLDRREFKTPSGQTVELSMVSSAYHIEMCPSDAGNYDRYVIQDIIKEVASHTSLHSTGLGGKENVDRDGDAMDLEDDAKKSSSKPPFKVVLLMEVDRLSRQAQAALRRTMEKYSSSCRLILCGSSLSKVIEPVRSRCLKLRVPLPQHEQVCDVLAAICRKKRLDLPPEFARSLSEHSNRNLRRAILLLEAAYVQSYPFSRDQAVTPLDWEAHIAILAKELSREQTPAKLLRARQMLYELLTNCIPGDVILDKLTQELLKNLDAQLKPEITRWAAFYAHRIAMGSKEIFHLEAFVAKYMAVYKKYINDMFGGDF
uniref:AAA+ ATPase domain-containing protein n=1 Tax=Pinguiococcus pyrenoidosus TaxID=172671 RepID=A0A7R9U8Q8_9STRA|mmetsp:Transcript_18307/g.69356  ORF Transcript_18307/g.69356 Transcript_18307/m.69356 type:complete len:380 (+) Transcript_18307:87-1226(+)